MGDFFSKPYRDRPVQLFPSQSPVLLLEHAWYPNGLQEPQDDSREGHLFVLNVSINSMPRTRVAAAWICTIPFVVR